MTSDRAPGIVTRRDGADVVIRPISTDDLAAMTALWARLSPETIRRRFFRPQTLDQVQLPHLVEVDQQDRVALVAQEGHRLVGVARLERSGDDWQTAEFALTIEDAHQGQGIGTALLLHLMAAAGRVGITHLQGDILADNTAMLAMVRRVAPVAEFRDYGDQWIVRFPTARLPTPGEE